MDGVAAAVAGVWNGHVTHHDPYPRSIAEYVASTEASHWLKHHKRGLT